MEAEQSTSSIAEFYDKRGKAAIRTLSCGRTQKIPLPLRAPYDFAYRLISELPNTSGTCEIARSQNPMFLDLCCGTGIHSELPASLGYDVIGIDLSPISILAAKSRFKPDRQSSRQVDFRVFNAINFLKGEADDSFDVIFISGSLYYLSLHETLPQIVRTLKPGGKFICIETFGGNPFMSLFRRIRNIFKHHRDTHTLNSLIGPLEIKLIQKAFPVFETRYFDFLTLGTYILGLNSETLQNPIKTADKLLLNVLGLRCLAFKFVSLGVKESRSR